MEKNIKEFMQKILERKNFTCIELENILKNIFNNNIKNKEIIFSYLLGFLTNLDIKYISCFFKSILKISNPSLLNKKNIYYKKNPKVKTILLMGSGKKVKNTFNISTLSYLIANSLGTPIIKLGSHGVASKVGSRDILDKKGFNTKKFINIGYRENFFQDNGFMFLPIEGLIEKFDNIYGGRFVFNTVISYGLGLIISPYKTDIVMYGITFDSYNNAKKIIDNFFNNDDDVNIYVYGSSLDGLKFDEIISNNIIGNIPLEIKKFIISKLEKFSEKEILSNISVNKNKEEIFDKIIKGYGNDIENLIVSLNSSIMLYLSGKYDDLNMAFDKSMKELTSGKVFSHFNNLKKKNEELLN